MSLDFLEIFKKNKTKTCIIWNEESITYLQLIEKILEWRGKLSKNNFKSQTTVILEGDFNPETISLLFALIEKKCIIIPTYNLNSSKLQKIIEIAHPDYYIDNNKKINLFDQNKNCDSSILYKILQERNHPGIILLSSGSSGEPKAAVHDLFSLLKKFIEKKQSMITLNFLLFDHWGGLNTMFHILANSGTIVSTSNRSPENICKLIEKYKIELLPVSPTFLNLLILSEAYKKYNLSSLKIISYGSESMPEILLKKILELFPKIKIKQTYGLIEIGVLNTKSKNGTLFLKIGNDNCKVRVVDRILQVKTESTMLGYLNATNPFTKDGWFITGDEVEVDGEYLKILGRKSDIINVGGEKVYPAEVENVIHEMNEVLEVLVFGERNNVVGNIVCAKVCLVKDMKKNDFIKQLKIHCRKKLENFKIPVKIIIENKNQFNYRFKKNRTNP